MSYIMDALEKSEKERGRRKTSKPAAPAPVEAPIRPARSTRGRCLVAAALLVNAVVLAVWLYPRQPAGTPGQGAEKTPAPQTPAAKAPAPVQAPTAPAAATASPNEAPPAATRAESPPVLEPGPQTAKSVAIPAQPAATTGAEEKAVPETPALPDRERGAYATSPAPAAPRAAPPVSAPPREQDPSRSATVLPPDAGEARRGQSRPVAEKALAVPGETGGPAGNRAAAEPTSTPQSPAPVRLENQARPLPEDIQKKKSAALQERPDMPRKIQGMQPRAGGGSRELITDLKEITGDVQDQRPAVSRKAVRYHDLASRVRDSMPGITVSMLLYSENAGDRWINVNGRKLREGQEVSAGLKVEEITPDGAIFTFGAHRFYKAVIGD